MSEPADTSVVFSLTKRTSGEGLLLHWHSRSYRGCFSFVRRENQAVGRCDRCAKLRENWLRALDEYTLDRCSEAETIEAHEREESAFHAYMNARRTCTDCSRIDPD